MRDAYVVPISVVNPSALPRGAWEMGARQGQLHVRLAGCRVRVQARSPEIWMEQRRYNPQTHTTLDEHEDPLRPYSAFMCTVSVELVSPTL